MAISGVMQRFKGKIKAVILIVAKGGGIMDEFTGIIGKLRLAQRLSITVTAVANTDFTMSVPPNATVLGVMVYTTTAFGAATDATFQMGSAAGLSDYIAAVSIKAAGVVAPAIAATGNVLALVPSGSPNLFFRVVQSGAASATGVATVVVSYVAA